MGVTNDMQIVTRSGSTTAMDEELRPVDSHRLRSLLKNFQDKTYRDSYIASHTRRFLARQMRKFRGEISQSEFGTLIDKRQTVVSRLEDPKYGKWTLQTLFDVAEKLNVAVLVRFVDIPTFLRLSDDTSESALEPQPYNEKAMAPAATHAQDTPVAAVLPSC